MISPKNFGFGPFLGPLSVKFSSFVLRSVYFRPCPSVRDHLSISIRPCPYVRVHSSMSICPCPSVCVGQSVSICPCPSVRVHPSMFIGPRSSAHVGPSVSIRLSPSYYIWVKNSIRKFHSREWLFICVSVCMYVDKFETLSHCEFSTYQHHFFRIWFFYTKLHVY